MMQLLTVASSLLTIVGWPSEVDRIFSILPMPNPEPQPMGQRPGTPGVILVAVDIAAAVALTNENSCKQWPGPGGQSGTHGYPNGWWEESVLTLKPDMPWVHTGPDVDGTEDLLERQGSNGSHMPGAKEPCLID